MVVTGNGVLEKYKGTRFPTILARYEAALRTHYKKVGGLLNQGDWSVQQRLDIEQGEARLGGMEEILGLTLEEIEVLRDQASKHALGDMSAPTPKLI